MRHTHDFKRFPELTNGQMTEFYFMSPHKQITEDFRAKIVKVTDGDTVRVSWNQRDFTFPIRISDLESPELDEKGGEESQSWLESQIMDKEVDIILHPSRVEKWGRLLADIFHRGFLVSEESIRNFHGVPWSERESFPLPDFKKQLERFEI